MRPVLHAAALDPRAPNVAAQRVVATVLRHAPNRRAITVLRVGQGRGRPLATAPWVDAAIRDAVGEHGAQTLPSPWPTLAASPLGERVELKPIGRGERMRVPAAWIGTNLVLIVPLVHRRVRRSWQGPFHAAAIALATSLGVTQDVADALRGAHDVFSHMSIVVDATWWVATRADRRNCEAPVCVGHCLATTDTRLPRLLALDGWIESRLGLRDDDPTTADVLVEGELGAWPQVQWPGSASVHRRHRPLREKSRRRRSDPHEGPFGAAFTRALNPSHQA